MSSGVGEGIEVEGVVEVGKLDGVVNVEGGEGAELMFKGEEVELKVLQEDRLVHVVVVMGMRMRMVVGVVQLMVDFQEEVTVVVGEGVREGGLLFWISLKRFSRLLMYC